LRNYLGKFRIMEIFFLIIAIVIIVIFFINRKNKSRNAWSDSSNNNLMTLDDKYNSVKVENQKEVDRLLDKIAKKGYDSLTKIEKDLLKDYSNKV